ncbi:MAG TPA: MFS transporter [Gaiellaceae bacterium]|jgi:sugar phosphate permease|nr:MFS transporter [Gaiellaceae bacterium]
MRRTVAGPRAAQYGWTIVAVLAVTEMVSWGVLYYAFAVFLPSMQHALGWSRTELTGAFSLALATSALAAVPVGRWLDRHSPRALMTIGSLAGALLVLAWSQVHDLLVFYVVWPASACRWHASSTSPPSQSSRSGFTSGAAGR